MKQMQGKKINRERMERRKELGEVEDMCDTFEQVKEQCEKEKKRWNEFKRNELAQIERQLLDQYAGNIEGENE